MAATITQENVKFNGVLDNAVVLRDVDNVRTLILSDDLSAADLAKLNAFVDEYGSNPLSADTAGKLTAQYSAATVGGTATGLNNVAAETAGYARVDTASAVSGGSTSFLSQTLGTAGRQSLIFPVNGFELDGITPGEDVTSGEQRVRLTQSSILYDDLTGLANDATLYTATVTVDGVAIPLSIAGQAAQTFTTLLSEINTALGAAATADIVGIDGVGYLQIVSSSTGATSTVLIADTDLFSSLTLFDAIEAPIDGADSTIVSYTLDVAIDGAAPVTISVPSNAFTDLGSLSGTISFELISAGGATAYQDTESNTITIVSDLEGDGSSIRVTGGTLLTALNAYAGFPVDGSDKGVIKYRAVVTIDEAIQHTVELLSSDQYATYGDVITELNTQLNGDAVAAIVDGALRITSATTGPRSSVRIDDVGFLFSTLQGYQSLSFVPGTGPRVYSALLNIDGTIVPVAIQGSAAQTFTTLLAQLNTDLGATATAALTGGSIVITSATTGLASNVSVVSDDLFKHVAGFRGFVETAGAEDLVDEMKKRRVGGATLFDQFDVKVVGDKPALPVVPSVSVMPKNQTYTYFGGTPAVWRYLKDDTEVNP